MGSAPAEFAAHIEREIPRMAAVLEGAGLRGPVAGGRKSGGNADRLPWRGTMGSGRRPPMPWPGSTGSRGASAGTDPLRPPA